MRAGAERLLRMSRLSNLMIAGVLLLCPFLAYGQEEDVSLGELARSYRKSGPSDERKVIDNDNLPQVMDKAEAERVNGKPIFSIDPSGKTFRISSPDGSCSLSFDAKAAALISVPHTSSALPLDELGRLDGTASIRDGVIEVILHNGTTWELKEIVVGVTLLSERSPLIRTANLMGPTDGELVPKTPDMTMLYHLQATSSPDGIAAFRGTLDQDLGPTTDWHWAIVGAKGIPPAASNSIGTANSSAPPSSSISISPLASTVSPVAATAPFSSAKPNPRR
jgi:hypothetical protein